MAGRDLSLAWELLEKLGVRRDERYGPVILGRELLIRSYSLKDGPSGMRDAGALVCAAAATFLWGVIDPKSSEYPASGVTFGRADALMWFGIAASLLVPLKGVIDSDDLPERPEILRSSSDPESLVIASRQFMLVDDYQKAGRCAEEYAELLRLHGETDACKTQFDRAAQLFTRAGDPARSQSAKNRVNSADRFDNPFFRVEAGTRQATSICGSKQFLELRDKIKLG